MAMLTDGEREIVLRYLKRLFNQSGNPPGTVSTLLGPDESVRIVGSVTIQPNFGLWAMGLLDACEADGWRVQPPVLFRLLENGAMLGDIARIRDRIKDPPAGGWRAVGDPVDELVLRTELPFLDRTGLRLALRELIAAKSKSIVVVTGPSLSGKSYTAELVDHISVKLQSFFMARANVVPGSGASMKPLRVAKLLALGMGMTNDPDPDLAEKHDPRSLETLANWVMAVRNQSGRRWWLVLDGFDDPDIPDSTHVFLQQLAIQATRGLSWGNVCVLLLGYPKDRPATERPPVPDPGGALGRHNRGGRAAGVLPVQVEGHGPSVQSDGRHEGEPVGDQCGSARSGPADQAQREDRRGAECPPLRLLRSPRRA